LKSPALTLRVFTDFDGTVSRDDIGDALFREFGDFEKCSKTFGDYRKGHMTAQECWIKNCATVSNLDPTSFSQFVHAQSIDPGFHRFVTFCRDRSIPLTVLSDGFGNYIRQFFEKEGLREVPVYSNELRFRENGTIIPEFPHTDAECNRCANCKRNHVLTLSGDDEAIVYVGDGSSDECPVRYADIVFAKDRLVSHCERSNITYHRFDTFDDVRAKLQQILEDGHLKKRRVAELARKEVFMQE
jgi:2,3-diketo-5-methylthio-1-phosphopentane phosphatase